MTEVRRIVSLLQPSGFALEILNLQDPTGGIVAERDTWKFTPPPSRLRSVSSERRYQGSRPVGQAHDNATLGATFRVTAPSGNADDALRRWGAFIAACDSAGVGRHIEWRPDGATHSTFHEIRGPAAWDPVYSWVQFNQVRSISIAAAWPVAPLPLLAPMDVFDDFSQATESDYSFDAGSFA